ncbi:MAG: hypothetical protein J6580_06795, partial [Gilliamella sp.]|uniref:hypothetical protein n=1 Tax=Gilliamella sp. TaxID=1891236 RepID=UPI0025F07FF1
AQGTRHKHWQTYVLNLLNNSIRRVFTQNSIISSKLFTKLFSKIPLALAPLLLLPYSLESQALSATTSERIQGTAPYLTFDSGRTKAISFKDLLDIKLSDGTNITPTTNTSSFSNPIVLPNDSDTFANVDMIVPPFINTVSLNDLVITRNFWQDDDGDGNVTVKGDITLSITDKNNQTVNRNDTLDICNAPYKVELSSTGGSLRTQYGVPDTSTFTEGSAVYYISPNLPPKICYAKPNLKYGTNSWTDFRGPAEMWDSDRGFIPQSIYPTSYNRNFPTTASNGLFFDLEIGGANQLTWPTVTKGGITATMTNVSRFNVRVTLTGPTATETQQQATNPSQLRKPTLPQSFELVGYDNSGSAVVKYGFELQKWLVNRGETRDTSFNTANWCNSLGYRLIKVNDVTNAICSGAGVSSIRWCQGSVAATPPSVGDHYQRRIGAGFFSEWGYMGDYPGTGFPYNDYYWTSDVAVGVGQFAVAPDIGHIGSYELPHLIYGLCITP